MSVSHRTVTCTGPPPPLSTHCPARHWKPSLQVAVQLGGGPWVMQVPPSLGASSQRCVPRLHTRLPPPHCASSRHCTHTPVDSSHREVAPVQRVVQAVVLASVPPPTPASPAPASGWLAQVRVDRLQVLPGQWESSTHSTQYAPLAALTLQCGVIPPQPSVAVQVAHTPRAPSQKGVCPPHAEGQAELETGTQVSVSGSQRCVGGQAASEQPLPASGFGATPHAASSNTTGRRIRTAGVSSISARAGKRGRAPPSPARFTAPSRRSW